jgi:hypothetical protein
MVEGLWSTGEPVSRMGMVASIPSVCTGDPLRGSGADFIVRLSSVRFESRFVPSAPSLTVSSRSQRGAQEPSVQGPQGAQADLHMQRVG